MPAKKKQAAPKLDDSRFYDEAEDEVEQPSSSSAAAAAAARPRRRSKSLRRQFKPLTADEKAEKKEADKDWMPNPIMKRGKFPYLTNLIKALGHARGIVFVNIPKTLLGFIASSPTKGNKALAEHIRKEKKGKATEEYVAYALEVNRILRDEIPNSGMCDVLTGDGKSELAVGNDFFKGCTAQSTKKDWEGTSITLAVQMVDYSKDGSPKRYSKLDVVAFVAYKNNDLNKNKLKTQKLDGKDYKTYMVFGKEEGRYAMFQEEFDDKCVLDISLLCSKSKPDDKGRAHAETARLLVLYTISKEMSKKNITYAMMECSGTNVGHGKQQKTIFPSEKMIKEMGFTLCLITIDVPPSA
jgi:hypothetical protein